MKKYIFLMMAAALVLVPACDDNKNMYDDGDKVAVIEVTLNKTTLTLGVDEKQTLLANVLPDNATTVTMAWSSDKTDVVTVSPTGEVTAIAEGTATITVKTDDGGKTATCIVTVITNNDDDGENIPQENLKLVKILRYSSSDASKLTGEVVYEYDKTGNLVKEMIFDGNYLVFYIEYEYSGKKIIKQKYFTNTGNMYSYIDYFYDAKGRILKEESIMGTSVHTTDYEYDENGNMTRKGTIKFVYDNQNRLILEETSEIDVSDYYHKYLKRIYDNDSREIKLEYYNVNWELIKYVEKTYIGTNKVPDKELHYGKNDNQTAKHQHFYDSWGNLIETTVNDICTLFKRKYNGKLLMEEIHYWGPEWGCSERGMSRYEYEKI